MDPRIPRLRRKLAAIPFRPQRSHSFGEEHHEFRLGPKLTEARVAAFEAEHRIVLPDAYRQFLTQIGGSGAGPFYGLMPLERCSLLFMNPRGEPGAPRGFHGTGSGTRGRDLFLRVIEMGCTDICVIAVTGPLAGRVLTGNGEGHWGPDVSSATDFLDWYERWLNHMSTGRDNRALELTSPGFAIVRPRRTTRPPHREPAE
ncbi:SMI1/KNR4 family protein [Streptomyces graminifolii]|uniref:SMI1/KNR4 family protein n=1 Tax=Streptomyces graminifolii TaxID=1266771 RepID=UPI0040582379